MTNGPTQEVADLGRAGRLEVTLIEKTLSRIAVPRAGPGAPRRRIIERTIGWLLNFQRLTVRYQTLLLMYQALFYVAWYHDHPKQVM